MSGSVKSSTFLCATVLAAPVFAAAITRGTADRTKALLEEKIVDIKRIGSQPSGKGPADWFTGSVCLDPLFTAPAPARVAGASVTFEPGSRTAWHTHPLGQTLIVTAGCGWVQRDGGSIEEIHRGDAVWFEPDEKHWHGAAPNTGMIHIAIQKRLNDKVVGLPPGRFRPQRPADTRPSCHSLVHRPMVPHAKRNGHGD